MAVLASTTIKEITGILSLEIVRGTVTTTGDTYNTKFGKIFNVQIHDETTAGGAYATWSGGTITVTCTSGDVVNLLIFGE